MKVADFKRALIGIHEASVARSGESPPGMMDAILALPDMRPLHAVPAVPGEVLDLVRTGLEQCTDYEAP